MKDIIVKILNKAVSAPSGDNSQPWRFEVVENKIYIFNLSERDIPFYNYKQKGSYVAHGALIENIKVLASSFGYAVEINLFPDESMVELVATVELIKDKSVKEDILSQNVTKTCTNRKRYKKKNLTDVQLNDLKSCGEAVLNGSVVFVTDEKLKKHLGLASSVNEKIVLTTPKLHKIFFDHLVWTKKEEQEKKSGLYLKTLELSPPQRLAFRLFRNWRFMDFLNKLGLYKFVAKENAGIYAQSPTIGAVIVKDNSKYSFVDSGRVMQRVWLKTASMGLSLQPVTGVLFLAQRAFSGETEGLTESQVYMIKKAYEDIKNIFKKDEGVVAMMFRIGYSDEPSARSSRMEPNIIFKQ